MQAHFLEKVFARARWSVRQGGFATITVCRLGFTTSDVVLGCDACVEEWLRAKSAG